MQKKQLDKFLANDSLTVVEAMQKIDLNAKGILFVVTTDNKLIGTVTDGDIRRAVIQTGNLGLKVSDIMNTRPKAVTRQEQQKIPGMLRQFELRAIAVVDAYGKLTDIVFDTDEDMLKEKRSVLQGIPVIIMAGGQGTRLYPFTRILPKPLIPVGDVPVIERIMDKFHGYGPDEFYISVNYRKNMIKAYLAEKCEYKINYVEEEKPSGTAGSLKLLSGSMQKPFFVTNCDILIQADYGEVYEYHVKSGNLVTIISALKDIEVPYGVIQSNENGSVYAVQEKPRLSYLVNTGMYVLNPECLDWIPENAFFHMTDLVEKLLQNGRKIGMYPVSGESFLDMGEWEELQRMEQKLKQNSD